MPQSTQTAAWRRQVEIFAEHPGLVDDLIAEHVDTGQGRCASPACTTSGGYQRAHWPCVMSLLAAEAADLIRAQRTT